MRYIIRIAFLFNIIYIIFNGITFLKYNISIWICERYLFILNFKFLKLKHYIINNKRLKYLNLKRKKQNRIRIKKAKNNPFNKENERRKLLFKVYNK